MSDAKKPHSDGNPEPAATDALTSAAAFGFAMATQAFGLWLGVMSGAAKASQEIMAGNGQREPTPAPPKPAAAKANGAEKSSEKPTAPPVSTAPPAKVIPLAPRAHVTKAESREAASPTARAVTPKATMAGPKPAVTPKPAKAAATTARPASVPRQEKPQETTRPAPVAAPPAGKPPVASLALMPEDFRRPKAIEKPSKPDDLRKINGIGPKVEKVLHGLGIWTFAQIAGWEAEEIAWVDDYLGLEGRIERDGWIAEAARRAAKKKK